MRFFLWRQREAGRLIPRWQITRDCAMLGDLEIRDGFDHRLHRNSRIGRLVDPATKNELVPPLVDVTMLFVRGGVMVLTGVEAIDDRDYAQTWLLTLKPDDGYSLAPTTRSGKSASGH
jgi:hypothetical protein